MYRLQPGGKQVEYQGLTINIPKVGWVWDNFAGEWVESGVYSRSSKKSEQYWEPIKLPDWYAKKAKEERNIRINREDPQFIFDECEEVRQEFWFRRMNGMWFMNNGEPTYITGSYFFYLNFWSIDVGLPMYRDSDRWNYYFRQYCVEDPNCFGWIEVAGRRDGKTYKATEFLYEGTSRSGFANAGIQSKTGADAKIVFNKLVSSFKKLPDFFVPVWDQSLGTTPKSEIRFYKTSKKGKQADLDDIGEELESVIDFKSSDVNAYDGQKLFRYVVDEVFKTSEVDIYDRWNAHRECLVDPITGRIIGKTLHTSTVDLIEGKMEVYRRFWADSDQANRNENGRTVTGLYRHFRSAADSMMPNKYGNVDVAKNTKFILSELESKKGNMADYNAYKRRYPLSVDDAFRPSASNCHYDVEKLTERMDLLSMLPDKYTRGNFAWIKPGDISEGVKFVPSKNGNFLLSNDIDYNDNKWNQVRFRGSKPSPANKARFVLGVDPFDHVTTVDSRKSAGAGAVFAKFDPINPLKSDKFVLIYCHRPKKPSIFYDDMLKICWFFGCQMLFEDQKQGIRQYFDGLGCTDFMLHLPERKEPGIPATPKTHQSIVDHTMEFINDCYQEIDFMALLEDWLQFDITNTTKFDLAMASGYALLGADRIKPVAVKKEVKYTEVTDIFPVFR
jgi:hypothetical protein